MAGLCRRLLQQVESIPPAIRQEKALREWVGWIHSDLMDTVDPDPTAYTRFDGGSTRDDRCLAE